MDTRKKKKEKEKKRKIRTTKQREKYYFSITRSSHFHIYLNPKEKKTISKREQKKNSRASEENLQPVGGVLLIKILRIQPKKRKQNLEIQNFEFDFDFKFISIIDRIWERTREKQSPYIWNVVIEPGDAGFAGAAAQ